MEAVKLYRPVGLKELELIRFTDWKKFPPRLEWQPIFYPVLNELYASQIAREWNTKDEFSGYCGVVTAFDLAKDHFLKYSIQEVGGLIHQELWIPADELSELNDNIIVSIQVVAAYFGEGFVMSEDQEIMNVLSKFK